jgi:hypothetical protein
VETIAGFGDAVLVTARFALLAPATISDPDMLCCRFPLVAVMLSGYVPGGVDKVVVKVNVDDFALESVIVIELGLNELLVSADCPETLNRTFPVKPPAGVMVTV